MTSTNQARSTEPSEAQQPQRESATSWRKWRHIIEGERGGKLLSETLVQLARIEPGDVVLDVAGGYGEPSLTAARAVGPEGRVVCNDIDFDMLAFGRERASAAGIVNVEFVECDIATLDVGATSFDAVVSRMFLPDIADTLAKLHTFLKPGGRLAASGWGPMPSVQMVAAIPVVFEEISVPAPPPDEPGVFPPADADRLAALFAGAGFRDVETGTITVVYETGTPEEFTEFFWDLAPPMITDLVNAQPPEVRQRVWERVTNVYRRFETAHGRVHTENQAIWVVGSR
ncbi:MAG TPA: class I SAM-dependent methyltransferase [Thermomicrobiales bacterium]|nr:class I SAM-dependent methyltransferase [Thermomicrobiales bacterium]